jgi:hypothetical protein
VEYGRALQRVLANVTDTAALRYAVVRVQHLLEFCPEFAAVVFGATFFPSRAAVTASWHRRSLSSPTHSASLDRKGSLEESDRERLSYSYQAEAALADAAVAAQGEDTSTGWARSAEGGAVEGLVRLLSKADGTTRDLFLSTRAAKLLSLMVANSRFLHARGTSGDAAASARPMAFAMTEALPFPLSSTALRLLGWARATLLDPAAIRAVPKSPHWSLTSVALETLVTVSKSEVLREAIRTESGIAAIVPHLTSTEPERAYNATLALWALSLSPSCRKEMDTEDVVHALCALVSPQTRPAKVVRVATATLSNIADDLVASVNAVPLMAETHLAASLKLVLSKLEDEDLRKDAVNLNDALSSNTRILSSMERYDRELATGRLTWSPVHNTAFWREHFAEFEVAGCRRLKALRTLLQAGALRPKIGESVSAGDVLESDPTAPAPLSLAVACADIGEFVTAHPNGRFIASHLGLREVVMELLAHDNNDVRRHALLCTSKLMINQWSFVTPTTVKA